MEPEAILRLYDEQMRKNPPSGQATIYKKPGLTFFVAPPASPRRGWVIYTRLDADAAEAAIRATTDFYREQGGEFEWKIYGNDSPADIKERLLAHGFQAEEEESVLAFDLEVAAPEFWQPSAIDVRRVMNPSGLSDVMHIESEVWGEPYDDLERALTAEMEETPDQISVYLAHVDGKAASGAWTRFYPGSPFAELYGGATLADQRGKGLYKALVQRRAVEARERGARFLVVDTSPMSRPILERHGFVFLTHAQGFVMNFDAGDEKQVGV